MSLATDGVIALRGVIAPDLPLLQEWDKRVESDQPFNYFSDAVPRDRAVPTDEPSRLIVMLVDGTPIGDVSWHRVGYGPNARSAAYNIGIGLQPQFRGRGYGARAQRVLADHLFATTDVHRVEASTDMTNVAEQRALSKAGFTREGVLRGAQFRAAGFHDLVVFSRLRSD